MHLPVCKVLKIISSVMCVVILHMSNALYIEFKLSVLTNRCSHIYAGLFLHMLANK